jgi:hypothetical protein
MTFGRPWWLAGLALLVPLVVLHLRRRDRAVTEAPSLLVWRNVGAAPESSSQRRRPPRPWPLLIQAAIVVLLVAALAQPQLIRPVAPGPRVLVVDTSVRMAAGDRRSRANALLVRSAAGASSVVVVDAGAIPRVVYRGHPSGVPQALRRLRPQPAYADLGAAIATAAALDPSSIVVARAPEDSLPPIRDAASILRVATLAPRADDRALVAPLARCGIGGPAACEIVVELVNDAVHPATVTVNAAVAGGRTAAFTAHVGAGAATPIALAVSAGSHVAIRLRSRDAIPGDDAAYVTVPGAANVPASSVVTVVGEPPQALPLARAFGAVPGVSLRLRTPIELSSTDAATSDLVVVDGDADRDANAAALRNAGALLLVHPPDLPGGDAGAAVRSAVSATSTDGGTLLDGVDLTSLAVDRGAVRRYVLPPSMQPLAVADAVPLLAAGTDGRRRVALLAFEPSRSNLAQLDALPILARNLVGWASAWAPGSVGAGTPFAVQWLPAGAALAIGRIPLADGATGGAAVAGLGPGDYRVTSRGRDGRRSAAVAVSLTRPAATPVTLPRARRRASSALPISWWLAAAALAAIAIELAIGGRRRRT